MSPIRRLPTTTSVFDTYWRFAALRQEVFHSRVRGEPAPWTDDSVLSAHRFTNAYRAADRVSQYLIRHVAYAGDSGRRGGRLSRSPLQILQQGLDMEVAYGRLRHPLRADVLCR